MKKTIVLVILIVGLGLTSCGPAAQEVREKQIADSLRVSDSIALTKVDTCKMKKECDSINKVKDKCDGKH